MTVIITTSLCNMKFVTGNTTLSKYDVSKSECLYRFKFGGSQYLIMCFFLYLTCAKKHHSYKGHLFLALYILRFVKLLFMPHSGT